MGSDRGGGHHDDVRRPRLQPTPQLHTRGYSPGLATRVCSLAAPFFCSRLGPAFALSLSCGHRSSILGLGFQFGGFDHLQKRIGLLRVGALSGVGLASAYLLLTLVDAPTVTSYLLVCVVTVLQGAGIAVSMAVPSPLLAQYATAATMGRVMAFATTTGTVGRVVAPVTLAVLFDLSPSLPLLLTAMSCLVGAVSYYAVHLSEVRGAAAVDGKAQEEEELVEDAQDRLYRAFSK